MSSLCTIGNLNSLAYSTELQIVMSSPQKQKEKVTEIEDTTVDPDPSENIPNSDSEQEVIQDATIPSTSQKKKKKKKSKVTKFLGGGKDEIPQELVDRVLDQVKGDPAAVGSGDVNADIVREALEQLKIMEVARGKAGLGGLNKKDVGEHKVGESYYLHTTFSNPIPCLVLDNTARPSTR